MVAWPVDRQLLWRHAATLWSVCSQAPVAMVTPKPLRRVLRTWPASTPSGVGACHHGNRFPHLNKGQPNRRGQGWRGWALSVGGGTHLGQAGSKENTFKQLSHSLQELVHVWPLQHIHLQRQGHHAGQSQQPPGKAWGPESPGEEESLTRPLPPDPRRTEQGAV